MYWQLFDNRKSSIAPALSTYFFCMYWQLFDSRFQVFYIPLSNLRPPLERLKQVSFFLAVWSESQL